MMSDMASISLIGLGCASAIWSIVLVVALVGRERVDHQRTLTMLAQSLEVIVKRIGEVRREQRTGELQPEQRSNPAVPHPLSSF